MTFLREFTSQRGMLGMNNLTQLRLGKSTPAWKHLAEPFTHQVRLLAVDSGATGFGKWVRRKRDLRVDLRAAFGEDIVSILSL